MYDAVCGFRESQPARKERVSVVSSSSLLQRAGKEELDQLDDRKKSELFTYGEFGINRFNAAFERFNEVDMSLLVLEPLLFLLQRWGRVFLQLFD